MSNLEEMRHEKNPKGFFELSGPGEMRHEKNPQGSSTSATKEHKKNPIGFFDQWLRRRRTLMSSSRPRGSASSEIEEFF
jgi:hypothetical protein